MTPDERDLRNTIDFLKFGRHRLIRDVEQIRARERVADERQLHHWQRREVDLGDRGALSFRWQALNDGVDLALDGRGDEVRVGLVGEGQRDGRSALGRRASHDVQVADAGYGVFDDLCDQALNLGWACARVGGDNRDHGNVDARQQIDRQCRVRQQPGNSHRDKDRNDGKRLGDRKACEREHGSV